MTEPFDSPEQRANDSTNGASSPPPHFSRSLSSANFAPNGDIYDSLDEDWLLSSDTGQLSVFEFLDGLSVIPETIDKFNQRLKLQSREVCSWA
jgi:hypothetical protein